MQVGGTDQALFMIKKDGTTEYTEIAKTAAKKLQKTFDGIRKKEAKAALAAASLVTARGEDAEEEIVENASLPKAQKIKIRQAKDTRGTRVVVRGWVATIRVQSRKLVFVYVRDGSDDELQCVLTGKLVRLFMECTNCRLKVEQFKNFRLKQPLQSMESFLRYLFSLNI